MAFDDLFRLSSHAVITNHRQEVLLLKANYGDASWGLPGGALDIGETIHEALERECREEIACEITINYLSGVYYHSKYNSQAFFFRCELADDAVIQLSDEHTGFQYKQIDSLPPIQQRRVKDCLNFSGTAISAKF